MFYFFLRQPFSHNRPAARYTWIAQFFSLKMAKQTAFFRLKDSATIISDIFKTNHKLPCQKLFFYAPNADAKIGSVKNDVTMPIFVARMRISASRNVSLWQGRIFPRRGTHLYGKDAYFCVAERIFVARMRISASRNASVWQG